MKAIFISKLSCHVCTFIVTTDVTKIETHVRIHERQM